MSSIGDDSHKRNVYDELSVDNLLDIEGNKTLKETFEEFAIDKQLRQVHVLICALKYMGIELTRNEVTSLVKQYKETEKGYWDIKLFAWFARSARLTESDGWKQFRDTIDIDQLDNTAMDQDLDQSNLMVLFFFLFCFFLFLWTKFAVCACVCFHKKCKVKVCVV